LPRHRIPAVCKKGAQKKRLFNLFEAKNFVAAVKKRNEFFDEIKSDYLKISPQEKRKITP